MPEPTQTSGTTLSDEEYKKMCRQVRLHQLAKRGNKRKAKPVLRPVGEVNVVTRNLTVEKSSTDWDTICDEIFSLDINGTQLFIKTGKEKARNLITGKTIPVGGAAVFRVFL